MSIEQHSPGGTWQSTWINLIQKANEQYLAGRRIEAYATLRILYQWLPIKCKEDCKEIYDHTRKEIDSIKIIAYDFLTARNRFNAVAHRKLTDLIPPLIAAFQESLELRGWISKNGGYGGVDPNEEARKF